MNIPPIILRMAIAVALVAATIPSPSPASAAGAGAAPKTLGRLVVTRDAVTVNDRLIRLGDLFRNVGDKAAVAVAYAPPPGRRAVFDARWLQRVARAHGLDWRPTSLGEQVIVQRKSVVIGPREISDRILAALAEQGIDTDHTRVELSNRMFRLHLPADEASAVTVEDMAYDARRGRFAAVIAASADGLPAQRMRITGRLDKIAEVPVPARRIGPGEIIVAGDIAWKEMSSRRLQRGVALAADQLLGLTPKRGLRAGVPIRITDVRPPIVVAKGELVTIVLKTAGMILTARGRALQDGGKGKAIRVANVQSHAVIEAVVTAPGAVAVGGSDTARLH